MIAKIDIKIKERIRRWVETELDNLFERAEKVMKLNDDGYGSPSIEIKLVVQKGQINQVSFGDFHKKLK